MDNKIKSSSLEEIKIPIFDGDVNEWISFHDLFKTLVHETDISKGEKMIRLKSLVKGEAAKLISYLNVTGENYEVAWNILRKRFENKRLVFTNLVDKLLDHPTIKYGSADSIQSLLDAANACIFALENPKIPLNEESPFLARVLLRKLDSKTLMQYEQNVKKTKDIQILDDVLHFLEQQYQILDQEKSEGGAIQKSQQESSDLDNLEKLIPDIEEDPKEVAEAECSQKDCHWSFTATFKDKEFNQWKLDNRMYIPKCIKFPKTTGFRVKISNVVEYTPIDSSNDVSKEMEKPAEKQMTENRVETDLPKQNKYFTATK